MTVSAVLPLSISKEIRALAFPWLACLACIVAPAFADAPRFLGALSVPAYFLGAAALGALSMGHQYTDRTLSLLLSLPARRERLFAVKLGVLAAMLLTLWAVAYTLVFGDARMPQADKTIVSLVPVLCGLFLAPWLTMVCRNPLGGAVFTLTIPGILVVAGELLGVAQYGYGSVMEAFRMAFVWFGTLGLCVVGAVASWKMFVRLEAIDGRGQDVSLPRWLPSRSTTSPASIRRHPAWLLVKKEMRLQQLSFALAPLYALSYLCAAWLPLVISDSLYWTALTSSAILHAALLSLVIGSTASAAERQSGTLEWQILMPIAASKQFAVKAGVAVSLAIVLGLCLPTGLFHLTRLVRSHGPAWPFGTALGPIAVITLLTSGSLYVSSLCRSGLWALVMSVPAALGAWIFLNVTMDLFGISWLAPTRIPTVLTLLLITGVIAILLRFAFTNHRSADRPAGRVWKQIILLAAFVTAAVMTVAIVQAA